MGAAGIELPDFITPRLIEHTYARVQQIKRMGAGNAHAHALRARGLNMARDRNARMLLFLEKGAEYLRKESEAQQDRFEETGHARTEFSEYSTWRTAYEKAVEPRQDERAMLEIWGWIYAAVAEAVG